MVVIGIAIKLIGFADGTAVCYLPALAADDGVCCAVFVGNFKLHQQLRQSIVRGVVDAAPLQVVCIVARSGEASALEDDAHSVVSIAQDIGHVVSVKIDAPRIVAQCGFEKLIFGHFDAVEEHLVLTQSTDVKARTFDIFAERELLA